VDRSRGGLGIGLSLGKRLVELHGGTVQAASAGPGRGATFTVRLPQRERRAAQREAAPAVRRQIEPTTFLVADDNRDAARSLALLLEADGHAVHLAYDGEQALHLLRQARPPVALLDLGMPRLSGFEVVRAVRAEPALAGTVAIALSGYGQQADREQTDAAGFDAHLLKPAELDDVYRTTCTGRWNAAGVPPDVRCARGRGGNRACLEPSCPHPSFRSSP
jgi:CheY-like chemotaxis protein